MFVKIMIILMVIISLRNSYSLLNLKKGYNKENINFAISFFQSLLARSNLNIVPGSAKILKLKKSFSSQFSTLTLKSF